MSRPWWLSNAWTLFIAGAVGGMALGTLNGPWLPLVRTEQRMKLGVMEHAADWGAVNARLDKAIDYSEAQIKAIEACSQQYESVCGSTELSRALARLSALYRQKGDEELSQLAERRALVACTRTKDESSCRGSIAAAVTKCTSKRRVTREP
jgi:hypothetical protein